MMESMPPTPSSCCLFSFFEQEWRQTQVLSWGQDVGRITWTTLLLQASTLLEDHSLGSTEVPPLRDRARSQEIDR